MRSAEVARANRGSQSGTTEAEVATAGTRTRGALCQLGRQNLGKDIGGECDAALTGHGDAHSGRHGARRASQKQHAVAEGKERLAPSLVGRIVPFERNLRRRIEDRLAVCARATSDFSDLLHRGKTKPGQRVEGRGATPESTPDALTCAYFHRRKHRKSRGLQACLLVPAAVRIASGRSRPGRLGRRRHLAHFRRASGDRSHRRGGIGGRRSLTRLRPRLWRAFRCLRGGDARQSECQDKNDRSRRVCHRSTPQRKTTLGGMRVAFVTSSVIEQTCLRYAALLRKSLCMSASEPKRLLPGDCSRVRSDAGRREAARLA